VRTISTSTDIYKKLQFKGIDSFIPTRAETRLALSIGGLAAIFAAMRPSPLFGFHRVWRYPSSFVAARLPVFSDSSFQIYRDAPDLSYNSLFGSTFWATFYSSFAILSFVSIRGVLAGLECHTLRCCQFACQPDWNWRDTSFQDHSLNPRSQDALCWILSRKRPAGGNILLLVLGTSLLILSNTLLVGNQLLLLSRVLVSLVRTDDRHPARSAW
jgi:hypothetical protein